MNRIALLVSATLIATIALAGPARAAMVGPPSKDYGSLTVGTSSTPSTFGLTTTPTFCIPDPILGFCITDTRFTVDTTPLGGGPGATKTVGDFVFHNLNCPYPSLTSPALLNGISSFCQFEVSFAPIAAGPRPGNITFPETLGTAASLSLTGTGVLPPTTATTFDLKAAIKRCKKKFPKGPKRKKCIRKARSKAG